MPSPLARAVDTVRKRYKRELAKAQKVAATSTGSAKEAAEQRVQRAEQAIERLKYDRTKGGYSTRVSENIEQIEFSSRTGQRVGRERLRMSGQESEFYAATKMLWQGVSSNPDQAIIAGFNAMTLDQETAAELAKHGIKPGKINTLDEVITALEILSGHSFTNPPEPTDEEAFYQDKKVREVMLSVQKVMTK